MRHLSSRRDQSAESSYRFRSVGLTIALDALAALICSSLLAAGPAYCTASSVAGTLYT
jgi:hypothetical protein